MQVILAGFTQTTHNCILHRRFTSCGPSWITVLVEVWSVKPNNCISLMGSVLKSVGIHVLSLLVKSVLCWLNHHYCWLNHIKSGKITIFVAENHHGMIHMCIYIHIYTYTYIHTHMQKIYMIIYAYIYIWLYKYIYLMFSMDLCHTTGRIFTEFHQCLQRSWWHSAIAGSLQRCFWAKLLSSWKFKTRIPGNWCWLEGIRLLLVGLIYDGWLDISAWNIADLCWS